MGFHWISLGGDGSRLSPNRSLPPKHAALACSANLSTAQRHKAALPGLLREDRIAVEELTKCQRRRNGVMPRPYEQVHIVPLERQPGRDREQLGLLRAVWTGR